ncbi:predicted protein [Plenodomus lingam JN3]|uniref:Predicted protein n=1 Tax=Leptosphaeria maculans (strain JN3 / isolate v23.1.3 / race Av1-4-5-6-7-8) TaxID=985895 RepID=E4ZME4_LEPMJ|nr:predicted protein [Plenodomus lingam JN3]CBX92493.1 predicted protein [Plenodomus lingam JN3]
MNLLIACSANYNPLVEPCISEEGPRVEKGDGEVTSIGKLAATASPMTIPTVQRRLIQVSDCKTDYNENPEGLRVAYFPTGFRNCRSE